MKVKATALWACIFLVAMVLVTVAPPAQAAGSSAGNSIEAKPYTVDSTTPGAPAQTTLPSMGWYLFKMVLSLGIIGGLAYGAVRWFPRNLNLMNGGEYISVYDQYSLGQNKGIYIAEIGGRIMALGVTDNNITLLSEINDPDLIRDMRENHVNRAATVPVEQNLLSRLLGKVGVQKELPFSTHISQQIAKLQQISQGEQPKERGKDDVT
ncbi:MAG TPA: flagellar biosynthetic protein FliO [Bacillota bacterium]|nr:flagellar biosynthetic protein FliO [Bacillota bacterium]